LTDSGSGTLIITSIVPGGDFAQTNTCGRSLAAGAECTITVAFKPTAVGRREGSVTITDNAPGSPHVITLTGEGITAPAISLSSASLIFGNQLIGTTSPAQTVALTNSGNATLNITSVAASGDFAQTSNCGTSLAAGASCTIRAASAPSGEGVKTGGVAVTSEARDRVR